MATPQAALLDKVKNALSTPKGLGYQFAEDLKNNDQREPGGWQSSSPDQMTIPEYIDSVLAGPRGPTYDPSTQQAPAENGPRWASTNPSTRTIPDALSDFIVDKQMEMNRNGSDPFRGPRGLASEVGKAFRTEVGTSEELTLPVRGMRGRPPVPGDKSPAPPVPNAGFNPGLGIPGATAFATPQAPKRSPPGNVAAAIATRVQPAPPTPARPEGGRPDPFASEPSQSTAGVASVDPISSGSASFEKAYNEELAANTTKSDVPTLPGGTNVNPFSSEYEKAEKEWREATNDSGKWWVMLLAAMFPQFGHVLQIRDNLKEKKMLAARSRFKDVLDQQNADKTYQREREIKELSSRLRISEDQAKALLDRQNEEYKLNHTYDDYVTPEGTSTARIPRSAAQVPERMVPPSVASAKIHERSANRGYGLEERRLNQGEWANAELFKDKNGNYVKVSRTGQVKPVPPGLEPVYKPGSENENSNMKAITIQANDLLGLPSDAGEDQRVEAYQAKVDAGEYTSVDQARQDTLNRAYQSVQRFGTGFNKQQPAAPANGKPAQKF